MTDRVFNVLFLCTGNTARSILAESILRKFGAGRFNAYSAGSHPKGAVNPFALKVLERLEHPTDGLRSKKATIAPSSPPPVSRESGSSRPASTKSTTRASSSRARDSTSTRSRLKSTASS